MAKAKQNLSLKDAIVEAIKQKKGRDIVVIDLTGNEQAIADYYIICHGNSTSQVDALADHIERFARTETSEHPSHIEGQQNAQWVLMDTFSRRKSAISTILRTFGPTPKKKSLKTKTN